MSDPARDGTVPVASLGIGTVLAERYELRERLGEGGMGAVFRALDRELDEPVALKVLHPELARDAAALARFRREVKLARRVTHPAVARTYDLGRHHDTLFLTMELIAGESLADRAAGTSLSLAEALRITAAVSHGLAAAHAQGVVHRDLKPDNVMLAGDRVVITDFGIARLAGGTGTSLTAGVVIGTPAYMAPEQLQDAELDGRADVYALGVLLFELLTRRLPFAGDTPFALAAARLGTAPPDPRTLVPTVPPPVAQLVLSALARRREDRPDAQSFADRVEALRGGGGLATPRTTATVSLDLPALPEVVRSVRVDPIAADDEAASLAADLARGLADTVARLRGLRVATAGEAPDLRLEGELRASGERARIRMRLLDREERTLWADRVEGHIDDPFALEDAVGAAVAEALARHSGAARGPKRLEHRARFEEAHAAYDRFDAPSVRQAIAILEELHAEAPDDTAIACLLARALPRLWRQLGATDESMMARAEELALRALAAEPGDAEPYHAVGVLRWQMGELAGGLRAELEALRRAPLHAEAHFILGDVLCTTGRGREGLARIAVALRLAPRMMIAHLARIRTLALLGQRQEAEEALRQAEGHGGPLSTVVARMRLVSWWRDHEGAGKLADLIEAAHSGASWERAVPMLRGYAQGKVPKEVRDAYRMLTDPKVAPQQRVLMHESAAEAAADAGDAAEALEHVLAAAAIPTSVNLLWLDRCPNLDPLRADPRFAEARAVVAARVAAIYDGAVAG